MQITRVVKQAEDGSYTTTLMLTEEETAFLISFAVGILVKEGTLKFFDLENPEDETKEGEAASFLARLDPTKMGQS